MTTAADILFGRLVLEGSLATRHQVESCLANAGEQSLPRVMVTCGLLDVPQARHLARVVAHRQFLRAELVFAQLLTRHGLVSRVALREAFEIQKRGGSRERLAKILYDCRLMSQEQLETVVNAQLLELAEEEARTLRQGLGSTPQAPEDAPDFHGDPTHEMERPPGLAQADPSMRLDDLADETLAVDSSVLAAAGVNENLRDSESDMEIAAVVPTHVDPPTELSWSSSRIVRAFESALLMAGIRGMLWRQSAKAGQAKSKPITVIWDAKREMFKSPLEPFIADNDMFQLADGNVYQVARSSVLEIEGTPCYQQVWVASLGISQESLRESWEGIVPDPHGQASP